MLRWGKEKKEEHPAPPAAVAHTPAPAAPTRPSAPPPPRPAPAPAEPERAESLEQMLVESGTITPDQLEKALQVQREKGGFLGQILADLGYFDDNSLTSFITKHCSIPHLSLLDCLIEPDIVQLVPKELCIQYCVIPIDRLGKNLTVAMVNPLDVKAMEALRAACPAFRIKPILCAYKHYQAVARKLFESETKEAAGAAELSMSSFGLHALPSSKPESPEPAQAQPEAKPPLSAKPPAEKEKPAPPGGEQLLDTLFGMRATAPISEPEEVTGEALPQAFVDFAAEPASANDGVPVLLEDKVLDGKTLLDTIFYRRQEKIAHETAKLEEIHKVAGTTPSLSESSLIVREMISVMQESMCDTYAMLARRMDLFRGLNPNDVAKIFAKGMTTEFEPDQTIFNKGDKGDELYVILSGKVRILDGARLLATLSKGDMFGEMALVSSEPRSAAAVTAETTSALVLTHDAIQNVLSKESAIRILENVVVTLSQRLRTANQQLEQAAARG